jgi:hypothetical protein
MNSANVHKPMQSDQGMEVRKPYIAPGFNRLTAGEAKELLWSADASNPEVQHMLSGQKKGS